MQQHIGERIGSFGLAEQTGLWRRPTIWVQPWGGYRRGFFLQLRQYLLDHLRVFNAGNHPGPTTAGAARFHIDIEYPLEPLRP